MNTHYPQGFFPPTIPMDNLESHMVALDFIMDNIDFPGKVAVVSPDAGGVYRARKFQEGLMARGRIENPSLAMLIKHRSKPNEIESKTLKRLKKM
jgi:ribose-phosphate pyrophosphokinase